MISNLLWADDDRVEGVRKIKRRKFSARVVLLVGVLYAGWITKWLAFVLFLGCLLILCSLAYEGGLFGILCWNGWDGMGWDGGGWRGMRGKWCWWWWYDGGKWIFTKIKTQCMQKMCIWQTRQTWKKTLENFQCERYEGIFLHMFKIIFFLCEGGVSDIWGGVDILWMSRVAFSSCAILFSLFSSLLRDTYFLFIGGTVQERVWERDHASPLL